MTREERIDWLCRLRSNIQCYMDVATLSDDVKKKFEEALSETISALEQKPCEDAISQLDKIRQIIAIPNSIIQEDVMKYKMICEVLK